MSGLAVVRYESLDIWRGVACLFVLFNHSVFYTTAPSGNPTAAEFVNSSIAAVAHRLWAGVPIFFVISGYCISASVVSHSRQGRSTREYFTRRFRRIFPPYWVVLLGTMLLIGLFDCLSGHPMTRHGAMLRPWWYSPWQWTGSITLTELWRWHLVGGQKALLLGHAWTLCYEEQFYAVTGVLLWIAARRFFLGCLIVTGGVCVTTLVAPRIGVSVEGFFFDGAWVQFAMGVLVYYALAVRPVGGRAVATVALGATLAGASFQGSQLLLEAKSDAQVLFVGSAFALVILWLHPLDARMAQLRWLRWVRSCGVMCYSLYLVHLPMANLVRALLEAFRISTTSLAPPVSILACGVPALWLAWRFHVTVERRFMSRRQSAPDGVPTLPTEKWRNASA